MISDVRDQILSILKTEIRALATYREQAARIIDLGQRFYDLYTSQPAVYDEIEKSGSVEFAKEAMYLPLESLMFQPTKNHLQTPLNHCRQIVAVCDEMTDRIHCAILEIEGDPHE